MVSEEKEQGFGAEKSSQNLTYPARNRTGPSGAPEAYLRRLYDFHGIRPAHGTQPGWDNRNAYGKRYRPEKIRRKGNGPGVPYRYRAIGIHTLSILSLFLGDVIL